MWLDVFNQLRFLLLANVLVGCIWVCTGVQRPWPQVQRDGGYVDRLVTKSKRYRLYDIHCWYANVIVFKWFLI